MHIALATKPPFNPAARGYQAVYRRNEVNRCPGCGRTHWYIGRTMAECGFCATAIPLEVSWRNDGGPAQSVSRGVGEAEGQGRAGSSKPSGSKL